LKIANQGAVERPNEYSDAAAHQKACQYRHQCGFIDINDELHEHRGGDRSGDTDADILSAGRCGDERHSDRNDDQFRSAEQNVGDVPVQRPVDNRDAEVVGALDQVDDDQQPQDRERQEKM
jgi:hypothetical protein